MKPATPVMTQTLGADANCSRRRRYGAEITSSQWKSTRRADSGRVRAGARRPIIRAARRGILGDATKHLPFPVGRSAFLS
jgi:hypothetical protein